MNRTLRYGSQGKDVAQLQAGLNLMPSVLPRLKEDGVYGGKTTNRVQEFQRRQGLVPDGVTGPLTWQMFLDLLAQVQKGTIPTLPTPSLGAADPRRPIVLMIAQQHFGVVDFSQLVGGRPKGIDFLIEMFKFATGVTLTDANFRNQVTKVWNQEPWVDHPNEQRKSWCGIFCIYCYKKAGFPVTWSLRDGKPGPKTALRINSFSSSFVAGIRQADIGVVNSKNHHFLIESVDGSGPAPGLTTIDGNQTVGRIERRNTHRVHKDNFNYYSIL